MDGDCPDAEREGKMNEHENDTGDPAGRQTLPVLETDEAAREPGRADLVVDLSGIQQLDLTSLALLLTAQQKAQKEDSVVWLAGVPLGIWRALHAMGLGRFFRPFPVSGESAA